MQRTLKLLAALCFLSCPSLSNSSLTAYDCVHPKSIGHLPITDALPRCDFVRSNETVFAEIVEILKPPTAIGYGCKVTFTQAIIDVSGSKRITSNGTETIDRDACLEAHKTRTITLVGNHIPFLDTNGTVNHTVRLDDHSVTEGNITGNHIRGYHYVRKYNITLFQVEGRADLTTNIIWFGNVACDYSTFSCHSDQRGEILWNAVDIDKQSYDSSVLLYQGRLTFYTLRKSAVSPDSHYAMLVDSGRDQVTLLKSFDYIPSRVLRTTVPNVFITVLRGRPIANYTALVSEYAYDVLTSSYSEPMYSAPPFQEFIDVARRGCENEKKRAYIYLKSLPDSGRTGFPQDGLAGTKNGYSFELSECSKINVTVRQTDRCFAEIPVKDNNNNDKFLEPETRYLYDKSREVPCHNRSTNTTKSPTSITKPSQPSSTEPSQTSSTGPSRTSSIGPSQTSSTEPSQPSSIEPSQTSSTVLPSMLRTPSVETSSKSVRIDWVKVILGTLVCIWGLLVVIRLIKLLTRCSSRNHQNVDKVSLIELFKPPFTKKTSDSENIVSDKINVV